MKIILASKSPRRAALLDLAKIDYEIISSNYEEKIDNNLNIEEQSKKLAYNKALDVYNNTQGDRTIIGADTFVVKDSKIYGKPSNREEAIKMLRELQGGIHTVYTSVAILIECQGRYKEYNEVCRTNIEVLPMSDNEIINYIDTERPYDKAGAYAIQSCFSVFISKIDGNYMSTVGLPIDIVYRILKENEII